MNKMQRQTLQGWCVAAPIILYFAVLSLIPLCMVFYYCFTDWNGFSDTWNMVGFDNFVLILTDKYYIRPLINTFIMAIFIILLSMGFGLLAAILMTREIKGVGFYRTIFYIPVVLSTAVIAQMANVWLSPIDGTLNEIIEVFGGERINWTRSTGWMMAFIIIICVWKGLGMTIVLYIAGINGIPKDYYEAASLDGANAVQSFFFITLPQLKNMTTFVLITSIIGAFNIFEPVQLISGGGPDGTTKVLLYQIYDEAFNNFNMGISNALSVVTLFIVGVLSFINLRRKPD
ncbi:MAG: sugar ABC transporter permease [Clostridia bacterium]|nr:sugar ABC transporter permease [Clostridia bacterium]